LIAKRLFDAAVAGTGLLLSLPLWAAIAVAVKPAGRVSLSVTVPDVVDPPLFVTAIE